MIRSNSTDRGLQALGISAIITVIAMLIITLPADATGSKRFEPEASVIICGDPRAWVEADNSDSKVPAKYKWVFWKGDKSIPRADAKVTIIRWVPAGEVRVWGPRWVRGNGNPLRVKAKREGGDWQTLIDIEVRNPVPWGQGVCPADRFGEPDWRVPHFSTKTLPSDPVRFYLAD